MEKPHSYRPRLRPEDLRILRDALDLYITKRLEGLTEDELESFFDPKVERAIELLDRLDMLIAGNRPKGGRPRKTPYPPVR